MHIVLFCFVDTERFSGFVSHIYPYSSGLLTGNCGNFMIAPVPLKESWSHDDVIKWKHFSRYWLFVRGIHWSLVDSKHKGQWRGALIFFFDLRLNKWLRKQLRHRWFEMPPCSLRRHCNDISKIRTYLIITKCNTPTICIILGMYCKLDHN